jgi:hypothetical protein
MNTLRAVFGYVVLMGAFAGLFALGCGATGSTTSPSMDAGETEAGTNGGSPACQAETFRNCRCSNGGSGTETCEGDGKWGTCSCTKTLSMDAGGPQAKPECGDGVCNGKETCATCPDDCGACPACTLAPTCTGASSVPANATALPSFDNGTQSVYSSGTDAGTNTGNCSDPLLKMRVSEIQIHQNGASGGVEMFCMVQADDGQSSELMVTPDYMNLNDNNPPLILSPSAGTFWGEAVNGVKLSQFNITVTYQCYMVLQPDAFQNALNAIAGVAGQAAAIPGNPYGWAFGLGGAAAAAAAAATAAGSGASVLLDVQQTIDSNALLALTNGNTWTIEQTGSTKLDGDCGFFGGCTWDWELDIEAWGCAAPKGETPK